MVNTKPIQLVRKAGGDCEELPVPEDLQKVQVLTEEQIKELASYAKAIEKHYGCYMDMEWGVDERNDKIWILQARPETVWSRKEKSETSEKASTLDAGNRDIIVKGLT